MAGGAGIALLALAALGVAASRKKNGSPRRLLTNACADVVQMSPAGWVHVWETRIHPIFQRLVATRPPPPAHNHEASRRRSVEYTNQIFSEVEPECVDAQTVGADALWKGIWCEVAMQLALLGHFDEEPNDIVAMCMDPSFNPRKQFGG